MTIESSSDEAKRLFAEHTDEINRRSRREAPDPGAVTEMAEIFAEHERECEALERRVAGGERVATP